MHRAIDPKNWGKVKPTLPLGAIPCLEIEGEGKDNELIAESHAILRYLGKLGSLYPTDLIEAMKVDSMMDTMAEMARAIEMSVNGPVKWLIADEPWTKEQVLAIRKRISTNEEHGLPFHLKYFENILKENGSGWLVGDSVTIADLLLHRTTTWVGSGMLDGIPKTMVDSYPWVKAHHDKIEAIPAVKQWRAEHPIPYNDFEYTPSP